MAPPSPRISIASPTGQQWRIGHGRHDVIVCEVGATLRSYTVGTRPVVDGVCGSTWARGRGHDGADKSLAGANGDDEGIVDPVAAVAPSNRATDVTPRGWSPAG